MSLWSLALVNVWALRRRLVGLVVLVSAAVAVCLGAFAITDRAQAVTTSDVKESTANRSITIDPPGRVGQPAPDRPFGEGAVGASARRVRAVPAPGLVRPGHR